MRRNRESPFSDLGSEGGVEINCDCLHAFNKTGKVEELAGNLFVEPGIDLQVLQVFTEHMELPKKDWLHFDPLALKPVEKVNVVIAAPMKLLKEIPLYVVFVPFPRAMQNILL
jgi:hypothetical protein